MSDTSFLEEGFAAVRKEGLAINTTVTARIPSQIMIRPHLFLGLEFTNAGTPTTPSGGTVTSVKLEDFHSPGVFTALTSGTNIDATLGASIIPLSAAGNYTRVEIVTTGLTGVDGITLRLGSNRS